MAKRLRFKVLGVIATSSNLQTNRECKEKIIEVRKYSNNIIKRCEIKHQHVINGLI